MTDRDRLAIAALLRVIAENGPAFNPEHPEDHGVTAKERDAIAAGVTLSECPPDSAPLDAAYRERNAVVAALIRTNGWPASLTPAPDADGWWIVYVETPEGQVSWHISPTDIRLFDGIPVAYAAWDRHTTDEKYERVARLSERPPVDPLSAARERLEYAHDIEARAASIRRPPVDPSRYGATNKTVAGWGPASPPPVDPEGLREAVLHAIRLAEVIPSSHDVEQAGGQAEVVVEVLRAALAASPVPLDGPTLEIAANDIEALDSDWCDTHETATVHRADVLAILRGEYAQSEEAKPGWWLADNEGDES